MAKKSGNSEVRLWITDCDSWVVEGVSHLLPLEGRWVGRQAGRGFPGTEGGPESPVPSTVALAGAVTPF